LTCAGCRVGFGSGPQEYRQADPRRADRVRRRRPADEAARKAGATWLEIGARYGLTKQGAQQRFRAARKQAEAAAAVTAATAAATSAARGKKPEAAEAAARDKKAEPAV
jgi:hypothetical protein